MKYSILTILASAAIFLAFSAPAAAATTPNCTPIYGGGESCVQTEPITVNLQVKNPDTNQYVDNLSATEGLFEPGEAVSFRMQVSNTGTRVISDLTVTDVLPQYIDFVRGDGNFDRNSRNFRFTIDELGSEENRVYFLEGRIANRNSLPNTKEATCIYNQVAVRFGNNTSQDNARLCIAGTNGATPAPTRAAETKGGTTIYPPTQSGTTPETGPQALALFALIPLGGLGIWLKKKA